MLGKTFKKLDELLTKIEEWTLFAIVIAALLSLFANVALRCLFNYTLAWSEELVRIVIIYSTFLGASVAVKKGSMIRIDAIVQMFPRLKPVLTHYANILMLIFACMMIYYGYKMTHLQFMTNQKTIIMQIPLVIIYSIMPITGVLIFIRTIQVMIQDLK
ncbi:TRAP transporter small permease [Desulfococcus multivorans]|jgi:TRAP-type C4-dicarboxylate transport system permease small subunit|uniref:Tripartite ATP-independent periplasmic transporter DctQ component n=1 Tax=Desulfococcus multivorans DSM 2059 TaxID=1121405 RepID=S7TP12_DESML|nr:TRAP transporter small permease [Desulfococcus multivorans]AOY59252.1 DctQ4: C4-TRAP dicarboxylate transporter [Desulfococcus multivorans]AQV01474.1 C4-dicarboxylate ABC transporter substrate-binding protein [Desulfococcus multivorans]EPR38641.1 Tripartite ATP-independent periplasmic transporter DctQ component [Desulfococcus multivorans DSM 2059]SKA26662.1 TRAP-type C4-dicarboxylate transport system, small permease component [Desulfococcus multivorans DSM 2059]